MKSQAVIEGGWFPYVHPAAAPSRETNFYDPLLVTSIKCNKYPNHLESESIFANLRNKKDLSEVLGDANSILCFSCKVFYKRD